MFDWAAFFAVFVAIGVVVGLIAGVATIWALIAKRGPLVAALTGITLVCFVGVALLVAYRPQGDIAGGAAGVATQTPSAGRTATFTVQANKGWQDTGVQIEVGNQVTVAYISGTWSAHGGVSNNQPYDGAGPPQQYVCTDFMPASQCVEPIPDFPQGALIGRVGSQLLKIGNRLEFSAAQSGHLALRKNADDASPSDHYGAITVRIQVL